MDAAKERVDTNYDRLDKPTASMPPSDQTLGLLLPSGERLRPGVTRRCYTSAPDH
jgi:hypothetical protein